MSKLYLFILSVFFVPNIFSQVGIGTSNPDTTAILHLETTKKGFLPPRMTLQQRNAIIKPSNGLLLFNLTSNSYEYYSTATNTWTVLRTDLPAQEQQEPGYLSVVANYTHAYGFSVDPNGVGSWKTVDYNSNVTITVASSKSAIVAYNNSSCHAFSRNASGTGTWVSQSTAGGNNSAAVGTNVIVVFNLTNAYAFYKNATGNGAWVHQALGASGSTTCAVAPNDMAVVKTSQKAYAFYINSQGLGKWVEQSLSGSNSVQVFTK